MKGYSVLLFVLAFSFSSGLNFETKISTKQDCPICELDNKFNAETNYSCFSIELTGITICTCPDGQYTVNTRCRLCDRPNICGSGGNIYCSETPTANPFGYTCFCPNNQFTFNKPCSDLTTTTQKTTITTTTQRITTASDTFGVVTGSITVTENAKVAERDHTSSYGRGASVRGVTFKTIGIHRIRLLIERMYMNRQLFIGILSATIPSYATDHDEVMPLAPGFSAYYRSPASGWYGNNSIAVHAKGYNSDAPTAAYNGSYEQYYMTNDVITLTINCEAATLTLKNERTNNEYQIFIDDRLSHDSRLPWLLYINLYYPGDKIRLLPLQDN